MANKITKLFNIQYPIIQGGMIWCSGWKLAAAVSNAGGLGLIGAGSMYPEVLREHIQKCKKATDKPFGVNVPMLYPQIEEIMKIIVEEGVKMSRLVYLSRLISCSRISMISTCAPVVLLSSSCFISKS